MIEAVCRRLGISDTELTGQGKTRRYAEARAVAALIVRESCHLTLTGLAKWCGRDVSAMGKAADRIARDCAEKRSVAAIIEELRSVPAEYPKL